LKTPDYVLTEEYSQSWSIADSKKLPAGSFVRPISWAYLPREIRMDEKNRGLDHDKVVFCYTKIGIVLIPRNIIRQA